MMGDGRSGGAEDESWTDMESADPGVVEAVPIRHGMALGERYVVEKIIGRGGSGVVVRAHDRDLKTAVAVKILRAELAAERVWAERLARETRLARAIHHPHVCRVFDFQQADGRAFLVMELAESGTLRDEIRSGALAARSVAARIADARAVASALDAIHRAGIVHRDLSPQNLLRMGDGRLVVSDFGLAVDVADSTSSVHGGTIAYMAPEVLRGGKATLASDLWALGVVMHEIAFGVKPRWSERTGEAMLEPEFGRRLTEEERAVLETCRSCTAKDPVRRIGSAGAAERMIGERRRWRPWRQWTGAARRPVMVAGALTVAAALALAALRMPHGSLETAVTETPQPATPESSMIVPTGEAADWTDISTVLVEVPERITCTRLLPDQRTLRFVWGTPPRAEDIDVVTRKRSKSPLVAAAYAEGCPDLSPDGARLVYQGHTADGRAYAFLSAHADGRDAKPVVPTAEPSMSSEPTWLPDGDAFSYDADTKHVAVFSIAEGRLTGLPEPTSSAFATSFRSITGGLVFVSGTTPSAETEFVGLSWPLLREEVRIRYSGTVLDLFAGPAQILYFVDPAIRPITEVIALDHEARTARRLGRIRNQLVRSPRVTSGGFTFMSAHQGADLFARAADGMLTRLSRDGNIADAAHCGDGFVVNRVINGRGSIERIDRAGTPVGVLTSGPFDFSPGCSPDGRTVFYIEYPSQEIMRCDQEHCRRLMDRSARALSVSPDGKRLVVLVFEQRGMGVWLIASDGSEPRYISDTETICKPGWASAATLWVSRRRGGKVVWVELGADSGQETGIIVPGVRDCSDGKPDPGSPVDPDIRVVYDQRSQLRLLDPKLLGRN